MTTQLASATLKSPPIGVNQAGIVLGSLFGAMHLGWVLLVASGVGQPVIDFVLWLHFIRPVWTIEPFEPLRACGLVILTAAVGYLIGAVFALLWKHAHRSEI